MNGFKGTKGKWEFKKLGHQNEAYYDFFVKHSCDCCNNTRIENVGKMWINHGWNIKSDSDALLISKAPEMLEMLEVIYQQVDFSFEAFGSDAGLKMQESIKQLIKEATEL